MLHFFDHNNKHFCLLVIGCPRAFSKSTSAQTAGRDSVSRQKTHHGGAIPNLLPKNCKAVSKAVTIMRGREKKPHTFFISYLSFGVAV